MKCRAIAPVLTAVLMLLTGNRAWAGQRRAVEVPTPAAGPVVCSDGAPGTAQPASFEALASDDVAAIVAAAAAALDSDTMTIAVVDRAGNPLAVFRKPGADPANDDRAVGLARTAAFFSNNMAPLASRTVRFISGVHFPPGIVDASNAPLYGIENTNRGCSLNVDFNPGQGIAPAKSVNGKPCSPFDKSGCGPGIVTGKQQPDDADPSRVDAGGIPLYRIVPPGLDRASEGILSNGKLIGGIGVAGIAADPQLAEFAAATGAFGALASPHGAIAPVPFYPIPEPGNVFIGGIRLPFLGPDLMLAFDANGLPNGLQRPAGARAGGATGSYVIAAQSGGCAPNGYLAGPRAGSLLTRDEVDAIVQRAIQTAKRTRALIRLPLNSYARMTIAVGDVDGSILALYRMPDATVFSIDVAVAKARNVVYFSGSDPAARNDLAGVPAGTAVSNRTIGYGGQPMFPPGIDSAAFGAAPGPFYSKLFLGDLANPCSQGSQPAGANQNGIVFFPGSTPLYRGGQLVGGLGVSGDGVDQDDYVTVGGAGAFLPDTKIWADQIKLGGVRLPMFKFPRQPEGVTECGGGPCN